MRVSLLSRGDSTSGLAGSGPPRMTVAHGSLLRHSPSGMGPGFWLAAGGIAYCLTRTRVLLSTGLGRLVSSDRVLVRLQVTMLLEVPASAPVASGAALEDRKNSVPLLSRAYWSLLGDCAGHTVKPLSPRSAPVVSNWVTSTSASPRASARFENAYTWALLNSGPNIEYSLVVT